MPKAPLSKRTVPLDLKLGPTTELGRFPPIAYGVEATPAGLVRAPAAIDAHEKAAAMLQAEVARRLAAAPRKEVVLFVHGYANTFQDASFTMGELCHFLGREFVCAIFTWPAGGSRGLFMGYNVDRESGEFAVHHLKQAIRIIADTPGVEKVHLLAHSRGTDVLVTALRELEIEAYIRRAAPGQQIQDTQHRADVARPGPGRRGGQDVQHRIRPRPALRKGAESAARLPCTPRCGSPFTRRRATRRSACPSS